MSIEKPILTILFSLSIIASLFNFLDAITTFSALQVQGKYETNPLMDYTITKLGWFVFFIIKIIFSYIILQIRYCPMYYLVKFNQKNENLRYRLIGLIIMAIIYLGLAFRYVELTINNLLHTII